MPRRGGVAGAVTDADANAGDGGGNAVVEESVDVADNSKVGNDEAPTPRPRRRDAIMKNLIERGKK